MIHLILTQYTVVAFGRHHKRGGAAFGRATSFAVSFVMAMHRVDVVALNTIFSLRLSKTRRTVGRTDSLLDGWLVGVGNDRLLANSCNIFKVLFMFIFNLP